MRRGPISTRGVRVGAEVEVPGRGMCSAGVGRHHDEPVAVCQVLQGRDVGLPGAAPGGLQQEDWLTAHAAEETPV